MATNGSPYDNGGGPFVHAWDFGNVQDFDGGSAGTGAIFDSGLRVSAKFWQTYLLGWHTTLKFPTSDSTSLGIGTFLQNFTGGTISINSSTSATALRAGSDNQSTTVSDPITNSPGTFTLTKVGTGTLTLNSSAEHLHRRHDRSGRRAREPPAREQRRQHHRRHAAGARQLADAAEPPVRQQRVRQPARRRSRSPTTAARSACASTTARSTSATTT